MTLNGEGKKRKANRLIRENSPYLLQHAYNPVDWYPWGEEAFEKALKENKPIFLSIGYSTCHWCHVMEKDSFEDSEVADLLNSNYVPVKVDREERPDLDQKYMAVCQALTGQGGWPLTVFLTPRRKAFYAGTFFPRESRYGIRGMLELLPRLSEFWQKEQSRVEEAGEELAEALRRLSPIDEQRGGKDEADIIGTGLELVETAYQQLKKIFDHEHFGFGGAPKFPAGHQLIFLSKYYKRTAEREAISMASKTLQAIDRGGIFDQLGYGIHRYSVDAQWLAPHFEKMLYDQAVTAYAALELYSITGDEQAAELADKIFSYVLQDMTSPEGAFYAAEDADSEGEEGIFYLWTPEDIKNLLGEERAKLIIKFYGVTDQGNFEKGRSVLHRPLSNKHFAEENGLTEQSLKNLVEDSRQQLLDLRAKRQRPFLDDKVITAWNGLMIAALARAAKVLDEPRYLAAAEKAASFIMERMVSENESLMRIYRNGKASIPAFLDDYASFTWGLVELYVASQKDEYLKAAIKFNGQLAELFLAEDGILFYDRSKESPASEPLLAEAYDGAMPSGVAITVMNLLRIGRLVQDEKLKELAEKIIAARAAEVERQPSGYTYLLSALEYAAAASEVQPHCSVGERCDLE